MNDIDKKIEELKFKNKGKYITQACAFNKECPRQMELLKFALENSVSFSGLVKEMLALRLDGRFNIISTIGTNVVPMQKTHKQPEPQEQPKSKNIGNFI
jgi:hypothetical protein